MEALGNLCFALWIAGTVPEGNLPLEVCLDKWEYGCRLSFLVYEPEDKHNIRTVICRDETVGNN